MNSKTSLPEVLKILGIVSEWLDEQEGVDAARMFRTLDQVIWELEKMEHNE